MPDIDNRKFIPLPNIAHKAGCADALDQPCTCGEEMRVTLDGLRAFFDGEDGADGVPESVELLAPFEDVEVTLNAGIIRAVRQALANQRARRS